MVGLVLKQERLPELVGWSITIDAYSDDPYLPDDEEISELLEKGDPDFVEEDGRTLLAHMKGIFYRGDTCYDAEGVDEVLSALNEVGRGPFDWTGEAHMAGIALQNWNRPRIDQDQFDEIPVDGFFAIEGFACVPGTDTSQMMCRLLCELQAHMSSEAEVWACYQYPDTRTLSPEDGARLEAHLAEFPKVASAFGFEGVVSSKGSRINGQAPRRGSTWATVTDLNPDDLPTLVVRLNPNLLWQRRQLWNNADEPDQYVDHVAWIKDAYGVKKAEKLIGADRTLRPFTHPYEG